MPHTVVDPWMAIVSAWANELKASRIVSAVKKPGRVIGHLQRQDDGLSDSKPNKHLIQNVPREGRSAGSGDHG
jgi:hypothetical protein